MACCRFSVLALMIASSISFLSCRVFRLKCDVTDPKRTTKPDDSWLELGTPRTQKNQNGTKVGDGRRTLKGPLKVANEGSGRRV